MELHEKQLEPNQTRITCRLLSWSTVARTPAHTAPTQRVGGVLTVCLRKLSMTNPNSGLTCGARAPGGVERNASSPQPPSFMWPKAQH